MAVLEPVADRLPERAKPAAEQVLHLAIPWMSWRKRRRVTATRAAFVERFFESADEFERYESEFFDGRIVDVCRAAASEVPDDESIYDAHMDECVRLYALVRKYRPSTIVETGVYHGVSTTSLLLALAENGVGTLHSLDPTPLLAADADEGDAEPVPPDRREHYRRGRPSCAEAGTHRLPDGREPGWIVPADLQEHWKLRIGRSQRTLPDLLADAGEVDLFVHDSEHSRTGMAFEFDLAWEHLSPGGMLVSFHVDRNDAFDAFVAERSCEHGRLTYTYNGLEDYDRACSSAYAIKPRDR